MHKGEFIDEVAKRTSGTDGDAITKRDVEQVVNAALDVVTETLKGGGAVQLTGFGTFSVSDRPERQGTNPSSGEPMTIAAARVPKFKPGAALKESLNA